MVKLNTVPGAVATAFDATTLKKYLVLVFKPVSLALTGVAVVPASPGTFVVVLVSVSSLVPYANQYSVEALSAETVAFKIAPDVLRPVAGLVVTVGAVAIV